MKLTLRDEMATRIAAALADSSLTPEEVATRAYATADALAVEREKAPMQMSFDWHDEEILDGPTELVGFHDSEADADPGPNHDPAWETAPRWSRRDRAAAEAAREQAGIDGPGLASARPKTKTPEEEQADVG